MNAAASQMRVFQGQVDSSSRSVQTLGRSFNNLNSSMSTPLQKLRDYVLILGNIRLAILNVRDIAVGWVGSLLQQSAQVERLTILMKGLSNATTEAGKSQEAAANLKMIFAEARRSGFAVDALADAFVKMKAGGLDPTDGSLKSLTNAVAAFGGTSDVMNRAAIAIQQMAGKGVISMEELRQQLGEAVPTAIADMSRAMGMSVKEFSDLVSKGGVQAKPALELMFMEFERLYGGAGERMAQTLTGQLATFKTNVMEMATVFTGLKDGEATEGGLFESTKNALKELNALMQSSEGRQFAADIGSAVNTVFTALANVGSLIIRFRDEIGFALKVALSGFLAFKAAAVLQWMFATLSSGIGVVAGLGRSFAAASGPIGASLLTMTQRTTQYANAMRNQIAIQNGRAAMVQRDLAAARQESILATQKALNIKAETEALRQKVLAERQAVASARQAQVQAQANIATNVRLQTSIQQLRAAKSAETLSSIRLAQAERALAASKAQLATASAAATRAAAVETAATARQTVTKGAATLAQKALTAATIAGAAAARGMAVAVNLVLGPLGLIVIALYAAAEAAGVFENRADRAAEAAARLRQGIGDLADMEAVVAQNQQLIEDNKRDADILKRGGRWVTSRSADGPTQRFVELDDEERRRTQARIANRNRQIATNSRSVTQGSQQLTRQAAEDGVRTIQSGINEATRDEENRYRQVATDKNSTDAEIQAAAQKLADTRRAAVQRAEAALDRRIAKARSENNQGALDGLLRMKEALKGNSDETESLADKTARLRNEAVGAGDAGADGQKKSGAAANKAATEYQNARDKYAQMIAQQTGDIAQLAAEVTGAEGALAEFQARVKAGMFSDATEQEIKALEDGFRRIDQLNVDKDWGKGMRDLRAEVSKTTEAANGLWRALQADDTGAAVRAFDRTGQVSAQYADKLNDAVRTADPKKIAETVIEIEKATQAAARLDAGRNMDAWRQMTEDIKISLMDEDEARQANFDREVERQNELRLQALNTANLSAQERQMVQQRYDEWYRARSAQLARENESQTVKMARDWARLGQNIEGALSGALNSFVDGMFDAQFSFQDFAAGLIKEIVKIIVKAMVAYAIMSALGLANNSSGSPVSFGDFLKGQIGAGFSGSPANPNSNIGFSREVNTPAPRTGTVTIGHIGGIIGNLAKTATVDTAMFAKAKSYHTGTNSIGGRALRPGEVPMIGMEGEAVLTEEHQKMISAKLRAGGHTAVPPVTVNVINNSNTELSAEQGQPDFDGREMIVNVVVEAAQKQGPLRDVLASMSKG